MCALEDLSWKSAGYPWTSKPNILHSLIMTCYFLPGFYLPASALIPRVSPLLAFISFSFSVGGNDPLHVEPSSLSKICFSFEIQDYLRFCPVDKRGDAWYCSSWVLARDSNPPLTFSHGNVRKWAKNRPGDLRPLHRPQPGKGTGCLPQHRALISIHLLQQANC